MKTTTQVNGKIVFATPTGLKIGAKGKVQSPADVYGQLPKGEARQLRKELRAGGFTAHASHARQAA